MQRTGLKLQRDERIMFSVRHHWIMFALRAFIPILVGAAALAIFFSRVFGTPDLLAPQPPLFDPLNLVLLLVALGMGSLIIYVWFDWANDLLIITNKRVVHEDRTPGLAYHYQTITLDRVQNVNMQQNAIQKLLGYGRINVQAAAPSRPIVFHQAEQPKVIQQHLRSEIQREKRRQEATLRDVVVQRRLEPATVPPDPFPEPQGAIQGQPNMWQTLLPLAPIAENGTITWHRHWMVLLGQLVGPVLALLAWLVAAWTLQRADVLDGVVIVLLGVVLLGVLGYLYWEYEDWRNDIYVLEPKTIIDIERRPLGTFENRREAPLGAIQNVDIDSPNVWARIFGYGNVLIETAGAAGNFTFNHVSDPKDVQRVVFAYQERLRKQQRERELNATLDLVDLYLQGRMPGNQSAS
jgi:uncharacterized membrane protein YdbT with pleckstrin-like domain